MTATKTKKITVATQYKACIIAPRAKGFDVFDTDGRWFHVQTQKQAKWWGSIYTRLHDEFRAHPAKPAPQPSDDHTPKAKEKAK